MLPVPQEFDAWLTAARAGSREDLGKTLEACRHYLLTIARHELDLKLRAKGGASDMVQETFLVAQRAFGRFQGNSQDELRAWLRRLLHDRVAKFNRRYRTTQKRRLTRETLTPADFLVAGQAGAERKDAPTPSTVLMADEQMQQLRQALARLPSDYQQVVNLRFAEKCSFEEIGQRMGRSANAARLLWLRAIERVKRELKEPHGK